MNGQAASNNKDCDMLIRDKFDVIDDLLAINGEINEQSLEKFVNNLSDLLEKVKSLKEIKKLYKYEEKIQSKLESDVKELEFLVTETRTIVHNTQRIKARKKFINRDLLRLKDAREAKLREEIHEMELLVAVYDKDLLRKWHVAKKTTSHHSLENFINNLAGRKQALECVYKLAVDRAAFLKKRQSNALNFTFSNNVQTSTPLPPPPPKPDAEFFDSLD